MEENDKIHDADGKTKSFVWQYFGHLKTDGKLNKSEVVCKICRKKFAHIGNTSNLLYHLRTSHSITGNNVKSGTAKDQPKVNDLFANANSLKTPLPSLKKRTIDDKLKRFVVCSLVPLNTIEKESFKEFTKTLEPRYDPPCAKTLKKSLELDYNLTAEQLRNEIRSCDSVAITHDSWTSIATESYETVTCHYITQEWEIKSRVLTTSKVHGSHNAEAIVQCLRDVQQKWELPATIFATSDNASVEKKAFRDIGWPRVGCAGHTINLIVREVLKDSELNRLVAKGRALVSYFHKSPQATGYLEEIQKALVSGDTTTKKTEYKLINDVPTRWNSTLAMLERLRLLSSPLHALAHDQTKQTSKMKDIRPMLFTDQEQALVDGLIKILGPFKHATDVLSADKTPTLSLLIPTLQNLKEQTTENATAGDNEQANTILKTVSSEVEKGLEQRFKETEMCEVASLLDPKTKGLMCRGGMRVHVVNKLQELIGNESNEHISEKETNEPLPKKLCKDTQSQDWLEKFLQANIDEEDAGIIHEIESYLSSPYNTKEKSENTLSWWSANQKQFPNIAKLARKYLAIPATSVPSERIFSLAGTLVSKKRAALKPENLDLLVFLKQNACG